MVGAVERMLGVLVHYQSVDTKIKELVERWGSPEGPEGTKQKRDLEKRLSKGAPPLYKALRRGRSGGEEGGRDLEEHKIQGDENDHRRLLGLGNESKKQQRQQQ